MAGTTVETCVVRDPRWCAPDDARELERWLVRREILRLDRRGKHLLARTDGGTLAMHLRMTGILLVDPPEDAPYQRVVLGLRAPDGTRRTVRFCDPRRFGTGRAFRHDADADAWLDARLGPEPFSDAFDGPALRAALRGRRAAIKALLLDQRIVAGVGNIYADEALYRARIHPERAGGALTLEACRALVEGVRGALADGVAAGGATIDDFRHVDGVAGGYQHAFLVHRREGLPCPSCGRPVVRRVVAQRSTYSCDHCQPRPRRHSAPG